MTPSTEVLPLEPTLEVSLLLSQGVQRNMTGLLELVKGKEVSDSDLSQSEMHILDCVIFNSCFIGVPLKMCCSMLLSLAALIKFYFYYLAFLMLNLKSSFQENFEALGECSWLQQEVAIYRQEVGMRRK